jgi:hypothetical protein
VTANILWSHYYGKVYPSKPILYIGTSCLATDRGTISKFNTNLNLMLRIWAIKIQQDRSVRTELIAQNTIQCVKIAERNVVIIVFNGVLCEVRAYPVSVSVNSLYMNQVPETIY